MASSFRWNDGVTEQVEAPESRIAAAVAVLRRAAAHAPAVLAASFGAEDMVLIDLIAKEDLPIGVFTLDTGRLPEATHASMERVRATYNIVIDVRVPEAAVLEPFVRTRPQRVLREPGAARAVLRDPQVAAGGTCAGRQQSVAHRAAVRAIGHAA